MSPFQSTKARFHVCCAIVTDPLTGKAIPRLRMRKGKLVRGRGVVMNYRNGEYTTHDGQVYFVDNGQVRRRDEGRAQ